MMTRGEKAIAAAIVAAIVICVWALVVQQEACSEQRGVLVRGVLGYACVAPPTIHIP